jgi:hypothetical protein
VKIGHNRRRNTFREADSGEERFFTATVSPDNRCRRRMFRDMKRMSATLFLLCALCFTGVFLFSEPAVAGG